MGNPEAERLPERPPAASLAHVAFAEPRACPVPCALCPECGGATQPSSLFVGLHGTRQEEMIDHRLTDREWAEEWKHLDHVRRW